MTHSQVDGPAGGRVLVTGAAGFIGSHLVDALLHGGYRVFGVDRRSPSQDATAAANLADALCHPRFSFARLDVAVDDLGGQLDGCRAVFHLAAIPGVRASWGERFNEYVTANIVGTARLLQACERAGVPRLVYASSSSVYGSAWRPSRETDPTGPISPYGVTKLAAEQLCLAHAQRHDTGLRVCALRYFTVYGPRQRPDMAIGRLLTAALDGVPLQLYGDGSQRREFTYVSDVVTATIAAAQVPEPPPVVNVGGGTSRTMTEVLTLAAELTGKPVPVVRTAAQPGDVSTTEADLTLARAALAYQPQVDLAQGMARQIDWLRTAQPRQALPTRPDTGTRLAVRASSAGTLQI
jgi:nucleoside-diphosphate-sugar epimerase